VAPTVFPVLGMKAISLALALCVCAPTLLAQRVERLFYYVDRESSYQSLVANIDKIDVLGPQVYTVDSLGIVFGSLDPRVKRLADEHGVKLMPLLVNEGFNQPALRRLLADTAARNRATRSLVRLCRDEGYWGIQFDVENVNIQDRDRFTSWYTEAANALHAAGCTISLAVVHRMSDEAGPTVLHRFLHDSWRAAHDLEALAKVGDFVTIMTYDQHTRRTPPGPVSALPWMREVIDYALQYVPAEKLSAGIPTYGRHWSTQADPGPDRVRAGMQSISWSWANALVERTGATMQWDSTAQVPFAHFANGGIWEWVFVENARSFGAKLGLVRDKRLRGFSAWVLGGEDPRIWDLLEPAAPSR
jgi:spore germination protein YaaH